MCLTYSRSLLVRSIGRMRSMEAPVVPTRLAITEPTARKAVFTDGLPSRSPLSRIPPEMMNSEPSRAMNEAYSSIACSSLWEASSASWPVKIM